MDKIEEMQEQLNKISFLLYNNLGILQRDSINIQDIEDVNKQKEEKEKLIEMAKNMGNDLILNIKNFDNLINELPDIERTKEQQIEEIILLNEKNKIINKEFENKQKELENLLEKSKECLNILIKDKIN
jgi:hypothetical protein